MKVGIKRTGTRSIIDFPKSGFYDMVRLGKYNYNRAQTTLEDHVHKDMIEICYYDKGSQWFAVKDKRYLVRGGDVFLHFPGEVHGSGGFPEAKGCLYWFIMRTKKGSGTNASDSTAFLISELMKIGKRHFRGGGTIKKILEEIFDVVRTRNEPPKIKQIKILLLAQSLLLTLIKYANTDSNDTDNERLQKVYALIDERLTEDIFISMLAKEANLSESRFKNWFKELSGLTPMDYVQRKRVEYAVRKIKKDKEISFRDLAYHLNFSSQQYFTTVIKKFTGKSPSELRM